MVVKNVIAPAELEADALSHLTFADCHERLGAISLDRIRWFPFPGTATEADLVRINERKLGLCELIDGVLVEKTMAQFESMIAVQIGRSLLNFAEEHDLGVVLGADGMYRMGLRLVRLPDVSFIPWSRLPGEELPDVPIGDSIPTLAVEVLSRSNTINEIERKIGEYFAAGVKLVWTIDPRKKSARIYNSATAYKPINESGVLDGGKVLPGFKLPLEKLFASGKRKK